MSTSFFSVNILPVLFSDSIENTKVLMQLRDANPNIKYPGQWTMIGGRSIGDENPKQAIRREFFEETKVLMKLHQFQVFRNGITTSSEGTRIPAFFFAIYFRSIPIIHCREGRRMKFHSINEMKCLNMPLRQFVLIQEFISNQTYARKRQIQRMQCDY